MSFPDTVSTLNPSRRLALGGAAAILALLPLQRAVAQTRADGGDWMSMVQKHHAQIAATFDELLAAIPAEGAATAGKPSSKLASAIKTLGYQLTAHSVAEENVLYPALAMHGLKAESDKLYLDQAHAKVGHAEIVTATLGLNPADNNLRSKTQALKDAVLKHAKQDEEAQLYPSLQKAVDANTNQALTKAYAMQFASVKPT